MTIRTVGLAALAIAGITSLGMRTPMAAELSAPDRAALLEAACTWSGASGVDAAKQRCAAPSELSWSTARQGHFVQADGEWLVSLAGPCIGGCPGVTYIANKTANGWTQLHADEELVTDECAFVRLADGRDHVACLGGAGPNQGFMTQWLDLRGYGAKAAPIQLLRQESGGECSLGNATASTEYVGDQLSDLATGTAGALLTVNLTVRRAPCTPGNEDPDAKATVRGKHELKFVQRGNDIVPDAQSADVIKRNGWSPES